MSDFQVAYIPVGVPTFHQESTRDLFDKSVSMIKSLSDDGAFPEGPLLSLDDLGVFLNKINPDVLILQNNTFAHSAYADKVLKAFDVPVLL